MRHTISLNEKYYSVTVLFKDGSTSHLNVPSFDELPYSLICRCPVFRYWSYASCQYLELKIDDIMQLHIRPVVKLSSKRIYWS